MRHDPPGILNKVIQQTIFGWAQLDQFAFQPDLSTIKIDLEPFIHFDDVVHRAASAFRAADDGLHPAHHFTRAERFRDVVICAQLESADTVILLAFGGEHNHRNITSLSNGFQHFKPVEIGHHYVEQY